MDARNKYKEADLWKYQECFTSTLKAAVVTMNKMEMVSFKGDETASDRGNQGQAIKEAAGRLRDRRSWEFEDLKQNVNDIVTFFDYPKPEIEPLPKDRMDMATPQVVNKLFNRHMKLTYDSFEGFRNLNPADVVSIMSDSFTEFKKNQGWPTKRGQYPYPNSHKNIDEESGAYILPEKFSASKSRSLTAAIKELEAQVKAGIEDQVEEEQSRSQTLQESGKYSGQKVAKSGGRSYA